MGDCCGSIERSDHATLGVGVCSRLCVISTAFVTGPVKANTVTLLETGVPQGNVSDGGASLTFAGYTAPLTLDTTSPFTSITTTVSPADPATLVPIANSFFGTTFAVGDDHRTNIGGSGDNVAFDISTLFFSLTIGMQQTAFFQIKPVARSI